LVIELIFTIQNMNELCGIFYVILYLLYTPLYGWIVGKPIGHL